MRVIIFTHPDGKISVRYPVRNTVGETLATDAEIEQRAFNKLPANAINVQWVDLSSIPADDTFRDAWFQNGARIEHDMQKCRKIASRLSKIAESDPRIVNATTPEELKTIITDIPK